MKECTCTVTFTYTIFWKNFRQEMRDYCSNCNECLRCKPVLRKTRSKMSSFSVGEPMQRMAIDILGTLHVTERGNQYVAVVMDYFTKWVAFLPMPNHTAATIAKHVVDKVFSYVGLPKYLHSDQGTDFCSKLFREFCKLFGIDKTTTSPWRPQSDGMVERCNRTLETLIRLYINKNQDDWDELLPICAMAYNGSVHSSTGFSPFFLMFGREMRMPLEMVLPPPDADEEELDNPDTLDGFVVRMSQTFEHIYSLTRQHLRSALAMQKNSYDKRRNEYYYKAGDGVWLCNPRRRVGRCPKLDSQWEPEAYTVVRTIGDVLCQIQRNRRSKSRIVHKDKLLPVKGEHDGRWVFTLPSKKEMQLLDPDPEGLSLLFKERESHDFNKTDGEREVEVVENQNFSRQPSPEESDFVGPITRSRKRMIDNRL